MTLLIKNALRSRTLWLLIWILWMGVIFAFSQIPGSITSYEPTVKIFIERKGAHVVEYAVLLLLSVQVFSLFFYKASLKRIAALAVVWSLSYAALDELHQFFIPFRGASMRDVAIDGVGICIALLLIFLTSLSKRKKTP